MLEFTDTDREAIASWLEGEAIWTRANVAREDLTDPDDPDAGPILDVRLHAFGPDRIVAEDGEWELASGLADYDSAHGCYIASATLDLSTDPASPGARHAIEAIAAGMIGDVLEQYNAQES